MKRYEEYKPSLTKWTSSIPQHWKQVRGKSVFYAQCENRIPEYIRNRQQASV